MKFLAWQIEITNRCNLRCRMCPRAETGTGTLGAGAPRTGAPERRDMNVEEFKTIAPHLSEAEHVVLEGWGESTLHPSLVELAGIARAAGPRVGFVTNGTSLDGTTLSGLLDEGLDFIGFSLAGGTRATHRAIRGGLAAPGGLQDPPASGFERICETVRLINDLKTERKTDRPDVRFVFLLLKDNIREAPLIVRLAADLGVKRVTFINLTQISNRWQDGQKAFRYEDKTAGGAAPGWKDNEACLLDARKLAKSLKVELRLPELTAHEVAVCEENPLRSLYISAGGDVSPCVFLSPPLGSPFKRIFRGGECLVHRESFGNIFREPFERIWENGEYRDFRERFHLRQRAMNDLYESLLHRTPPASGSLPPPPLSCASCHKLFGL